MSEIIGPLDFMVALCYLFTFCLLLVSGAAEEIHSYHLKLNTFQNSSLNILLEQLAVNVCWNAHPVCSFIRHQNFT